MRNVQRKLIGFNLSSKFYYSILIACSLQLAAGNILFAQDNSPYSRYGLGDLQPNTNIFNRGMGGISAGYSEQPIDGLNDRRLGKYYSTVNFLNPASYSRFYTIKEPRSNKLSYGKILLDVGTNLENRTLKENNNPQSFSSPNAFFSYLQLGMPLKKDWGLVFGLRPVSSINYKIQKRELLIDPQTQLPIDSARTLFTGDGGAYMFNTGTGFAIKNFSVGINTGYLFGKKDYSTRRDLYIDTVPGYYTGSNHQTKSSFGGLFLNAGMQYRIDLNKEKTKYFQAGVFGNMKNELNSRNDIIRETYASSLDGGSVRIDSVSEQLDIKNKVEYPSGFGGGFVVEQLPDDKHTGWLFGIDFIRNGWNNYRFNGQADQVRNNWQLRIGGQIRPALKDVKYRQLLSYRAGLFFGDDYIYLNQKLPVLGITAGLTLPVANLKDASRRFRTQYSVVNISAEYIKRGNKDNPLFENQFRLSAGFTLSDLWFTKRKYD
jgi:hypothetical protein